MVRDRAFYKTLFKIALPSAFQALAALLVVIADNAMVASLGTTPHSAVLQINRITVFYTSTISGLVSGSAVLISQYWGKKDMARIKHIFSIVFFLTFAVSIVAVLFIRLFPNQAAAIVIGGADSQMILEYALHYMGIVCFSYIPLAISTALVGMLRSVEVVGITLINTVVSLFVNIGLNYVLIFGKFGFPAMGVAGAALATVIARLVELVVVWFYMFRVQKRIDLKPRELLRTDRALVRDYARYGLPVGLGDLQWAAVGLLKGTMIGRLGTTFISANGITDDMMNLGTLFAFALAGGACIVIGKTVGEKDYQKTRAYSNSIQIMFLILGLVMAAIVIAIRVPFIGIYGVGQEAQELAKTMIFIGAFTMIGTTYHASCFVGINRGAGDSRFVFIVDMICGWLIVLPLTYLSAFVWRLPLPLIFLSTRIDQCFKWIIAFFRLRGDKWIVNVTREDEPA